MFTLNKEHKQKEKKQDAGVPAQQQAVTCEQSLTFQPAELLLSPLSLK